MRAFPVKKKLARIGFNIVESWQQNQCNLHMLATYLHPKFAKADIMKSSHHGFDGFATLATPPGPGPLRFAMGLTNLRTVVQLRGDARRRRKLFDIVTCSYKPLYDFIGGSRSQNMFHAMWASLDMPRTVTHRAIQGLIFKP